MRKLIDDVLMIEEVNLYLFLSIFILAFLTRIIGVPVEGFTEGLLASISMPVMYVLAYYYRHEYRYMFVKSKRAAPVRNWFREFFSLISSFLVGFLVFMTITASFNILVYSLAYICVHSMRLMLAAILPRVSRFVDIDDPAIVMIISLVVSLITLTILLLIILVISHLML